jgi:hypothetical protein
MSLSHLENSDLQEVFLSKIHSLITGNNVLHSVASHLNGFLWRDTCVFFNSAVQAYLEKIELISA